MTIDLGQPREFPTKDEIAAVERELNARFPSDYRQFLFEHGHSRPEDNVFTVSPGVRSGIAAFIPVGMLKERRSVLELDPSGGYLPIADAEGGNLVCLALDGPREGSIFFWDHELEGNRCFTWLAASLTEFLASVQPFVPFRDKSEKPSRGGWVDPGFLEKLQKK